MTLRQLAKRCSLEVSPADALLAADWLSRVEHRPTVFVNMVKETVEHFQQVAAAVAALAEHGVVAHVPASRFDRAEQAASVIEALGRAGAGGLFLLGGNDCAARAAAGAPLTRAAQLFDYAPAERWPTLCIAGYPEGGDAADALLAGKLDALLRRGHAVDVVTQFCFDAGALLAWLDLTRHRLARCRARVAADTGRPPPPVRLRLGVHGPTPAARLRRIAHICRVGGAGPSLHVAAAAGATAGQLVDPANICQAVAEHCRHHDDIALHFFPFGGIPATVQLIDRCQRGEWP